MSEREVRVTSIPPAELGSESAIQQAYIQLLSVPRRKKTSVGKWKEAAVRFGAAQFVVPAQARYDQLSYRERALILKVRDVLSNTLWLEI